MSTRLTFVLNIALRGVTLASKLGLVFSLALLFSPEELGVYGLMASALSFTVFGLAFEYHYYTRRELIHSEGVERALLLRDQIALHLATLVIATPLLSVLAPLLFGHWMTAALLLWFVVLLPFELISQELMQGLVALSRPLQANVVLFVRTGAWIYPFLIAAMLRPDQRQLSALFLWWTAGAAASVIAAGYFLHDRSFAEAARHPIDWRKIGTGIQVSLPFIITTGSSIGLLQLARFFIEAYRGVAAVGIYTFFASLTVALQTLVNSGVPLILMPRLVKAWGDGDREEFRLELFEMTVFTAVSALLLAIPFLGGIGVVLRFLAKSEYQKSLPVFYILLAGAILRSQADVPIYGLYAQRRDGSLVRAYLAVFAVSLIGNATLVPAFGLVGAAASEFAGSLVLIATTHIVLRRGVGALRLNNGPADGRLTVQAADHLRVVAYPIRKGK